VKLGTHADSKRLRQSIAPFLLVLALLQTTVPGFAASFSSHNVDLALASAVRIEISLHWPPHEEASFSGSGWTRSCQPQGDSYSLIVATAGHVIDVDALTRVAHPTSTQRASVKVVVIYRDGRQLTADREDALRVDRLRDYGEIAIVSPLPSVVLPVGQEADVYPSSELLSVASPGSLDYGVFIGHLIMKGTPRVRNIPQGAWLTTIEVAPGASGAPVLDERGEVVATVLGCLQWWRDRSATVVGGLPPPLWALTLLAQYQELEVTHMGIIESLLPILKIGGLTAVAASLVHSTMALFHLGPKFSQDALMAVTSVAQTTVNALEQSHGDLASIDKKQLAVQMVTEILPKLGIKVPATLVDAGIESAVLALNALRRQKAA